MVPVTMTVGCPLPERSARLVAARVLKGARAACGRRRDRHRRRTGSSTNATTSKSPEHRSIVPGLPDALDGLRIGLLTDPHRSETVSHELIDAAVRLLMAEQPDLIVLGGDYVTWGASPPRFVQPAADALAPLTAPHGVFAVLGNHDDDRDMPAALIARGFTVLRDRAHAADDARRDARSRWPSATGPTREADEIARVVRGAARRRCCSRTRRCASTKPPSCAAAHAERPHPRRPDRAAGRRRGRRPRSSRWSPVMGRRKRRRRSSAAAWAPSTSRCASIARRKSRS